MGDNMVKFERQSVIEREVAKQGFVLVPAMSEMLQCSEETIRRDLKEMEREGKLTRTHGGAYLLDKYDKSYPTALRKTYMHRTKSRLARLAMQYIRENEVIMLDSSTTCLALAEELAESQISLTVITNSLPVCNLCNDNHTNINLICMGGTFRRRTSSFTDYHTIDALAAYHADRAFISCPKISVEFGLSDNHLSEAHVREVMIRHSRSCYLVADHTKFKGNANILFRGMDRLDAIITDQPLSEEWESFAEKTGIELKYCIE